MALREILRQKSAIRSFAFFSTEPAVRQQNIELIRAMKIDIPLVNQVDLGMYPLVAIVDAQPSFVAKYLGEIRPQIVIDHHQRTPGWQADLEDIRENYGALSTLMLEYLLAAKVRISRMLYTALAYGIKTDTNNFERDALIEDIGAYHLSLTRANRELLRRIELNQIPERFLKYFDQAYRHRRRYRDRILCFLGKVESLDACVQVADFLIHIINIYYVAVAGIVKDRMIVILRGDGYRQDCGATAEKAFGGYGSAGGHKSAARVEIPMETLRTILPGDFSREAVEHFLVQRLRAARDRSIKTIATP
jgi:nanoRNase/pAp phosphatase (c-di-AMP/oligoRNAs hydrolase)